MLDKTDNISVVAENWLAQFETALTEGDDAALKDLFHPDSYWRDAVALSWTLQTINGLTAAEFWKEIAAGRVPKPKPESDEAQ